MAEREATAVLPGRAAASSREQINLMWSRYDSLCCLAVLSSGVRRFHRMRPVAAIQACRRRTRGRRHADRNARRFARLSRVERVRPSLRHHASLPAKRHLGLSAVGFLYVAGTGWIRWLLHDYRFPVLGKIA